MGIPPSFPDITKLIVEMIVGHEAIAMRTYAIDQSEHGGIAVDTGCPLNENFWASGMRRVEKMGLISVRLVKWSEVE
jgi:hypothetical protein